jgi:hypothetical protein
MNELRNDDTLTTADLVNPTHTPRQAYSEANVDREVPVPATNANAFAPSANDLQNVPAAAVENRDSQPMATTNPVAPTSSAATTSQPGPLFPEDELHNFRARWDQVQTSFVDEPRQAVEQADSLVANVVKRIAEQFANEREQLEKQWDRGDNVNTEDLRQALKRYRSFFDRLLTF